MFSPIFAEGGMPPEWAWPHIMLVMIGLVGLAMIIALGLVIVEKVQKIFFAPKPAQMPQPLVVTSPDKFASADEMKELREDVHNQLKEMRSYMHEQAHEQANEQQRLVLQIDTLRKDMSAEGSRRASNINNRVDGVIDRLSAVEKEAQLTGQRVVQIDAKIDRILENSARRRSSE